MSSEVLTEQSSKNEADCHKCPLLGSSLQISSSISQKSGPYAVGTELFFPVFFCEYKRSEDESIHVAFHRCQMDCISGVESLRVQGVTDFPVYGLFSTGSGVSITMAWHSTKAIIPMNGPKEVCFSTFRSYNRRNSDIGSS
ncbi:hypothetical protein HYPSUDRAFT_666308 [Hypholoma sublateritium FD-334 SS-4]|uniref:Uncharacterized protein n=1 Tax=Hypholoma sublateritium (strain FD-334 SS-4) TaxID=945553 RepID=A0A0D2MEW1_HYPSF|nr:hypothetical protein HYPSUDRAFT_666308 [Hypholoma sublateritium FD-334 SS-4]